MCGREISIRGRKNEIIEHLIISLENKIGTNIDSVGIFNNHPRGRIHMV